MDTQMIKTVIKHKLGEICIDELFRGIFRNFPNKIGKTMTFREFRSHVEEYIGMYITHVSLDSDQMDKHAISASDRLSLENAKHEINKMAPIHLVGYDENKTNINLQYNYNETGQIIMSDPDTEEIVEHIVLFTISSEPIG